MAKYRVLPSVAHNFAASFISVMHMAGSDYAMCQLIRWAKATGQRSLTLDVLAGSFEPTPQVATDYLRRSFAFYCEDFHRLVTTGGAAREMVASAVLHLFISPVEGLGLAAGSTNGRIQARMEIRDDRGHLHIGEALEDYPCGRGAH